MTDLSTPTGRLIIDSKENLFACAARLVKTTVAESTTGYAATIAFAGGSTPQEWFRWCATTQALGFEVATHAHFTVSDERHVPITDPQSNFGHAERLLLNPLRVPANHRHPWPVVLPPAEAAAAYRTAFKGLAGPGRAYDVCFLGVGDDAHTASLFPGSPLLRDDGGELFATVEVPGKGWRLTVTPTGLGACRQIVVMALGKAKATALAKVFHGAADVSAIPSQILQRYADRVIWLVDEPAATALSFGR